MGVTPFHLECRVGRLVELRPGASLSVADQAAIGGAVAQLHRTMPGPGIYCVDWRNLRVLSPEVAKALTASMREGNPYSLRSAALIGSQATLGLQIERVIREASFASRRVFRDPEVMLSWLAEVATPAELARAREFIESFEPPSSQVPVSRSPVKARPGS